MIVARRVVMLGLAALMANGVAAAECTRRLALHAPEATPSPGRAAVFVARELSSGTCHFVDEAGATVRHAPWSTFKIPNLLIALQSGAVPSLQQQFRWDATRRPAASYWPADWARTQTLGSAFERSAVWVFQDLALQIGGPRYREALARFRYGNEAVADHDDAFWLGGSLRISPLEQVMFISRLLDGSAGVDDDALAALEAAGLRAERHGHQLIAKTGSGPMRAGDFDGTFEGWFVGWVRRPDAAPVAFALYAQAPDFASLHRWREQRSLQLLAALGAWPSASTESGKQNQSPP